MENDKAYENFPIWIPSLAWVLSLSIYVLGAYIFRSLYIPLAGGIILLIRDFTRLILFLMVILVVLSSAGNAVIRGSLSCKYRKQKELGCPAEQLFNKSAKTAGA